VGVWEEESLEERKKEKINKKCGCGKYEGFRRKKTKKVKKYECRGV
jgi:hypothetical protein